MTDPRQTRGWKALRLAVLERAGWRCYWCGRPATDGDHVVPISEGGAPFDPSNVVASCARCNRGRGGRLTAGRPRRRRRVRHGRGAGSPGQTTDRAAPRSPAQTTAGIVNEVDDQRGVFFPDSRPGQSSVPVEPAVARDGAAARDRVRFGAAFRDRS